MRVRETKKNNDQATCALVTRLILTLTWWQHETNICSRPRALNSCHLGFRLLVKILPCSIVEPACLTDNPNLLDVIWMWSWAEQHSKHPSGPYGHQSGSALMHAVHTFGRGFLDCCLVSLHLQVFAYNPSSYSKQNYISTFWVLTCNWECLVFLSLLTESFLSSNAEVEDFAGFWVWPRMLRASKLWMLPAHPAQHRMRAVNWQKLQRYVVVTTAELTWRTWHDSSRDRREYCTWHASTTFKEVRGMRSQPRHTKYHRSISYALSFHFVP